MPTNKNKTPARKINRAKAKKNIRQDDGLVQGSTLRNGSAIITSNRARDQCRVRHREMLGLVQANSDGSSNLQWFKITPTGFPWLHSYARNWEQYRFRDIRLHYEPICAATESGSIALFPDMDDEDHDPVIINQVMSMNNAVCAPVYRRCTTVVSRTALEIAPTRYCEEVDETTADSRWTNVGWFGVWSEGCSVTSPGQLYVEYDVTLFIQQSPRDEFVNTHNAGVNGPSANLVNAVGLMQEQPEGTDDIYNDIFGPSVSGSGVTRDNTGLRWAGYKAGFSAVSTAVVSALGVVQYLLHWRQTLMEDHWTINAAAPAARAKLKDKMVGDSYVPVVLSEVAAVNFDWSSIITTGRLNSTDPWYHCSLEITTGKLGESNIPTNRLLLLSANLGLGQRSHPIALGEGQTYSTEVATWVITKSGSVCTDSVVNAVDYTTPASDGAFIKMVVQAVVETATTTGYTIDFLFGRNWETVTAMGAGFNVAATCVSSGATDSQIRFGIEDFSPAFDEVATRCRCTTHGKRKVRSSESTIPRKISS